MKNKKINNYFLVLFSLLPISIIAGSAISIANVLIIDISFLLLILFNKEFSFFKTKPVKYLILLYLYLIFNSFISIDYEVGLVRNLGFIRVIILFVAFNYFLNKKFFLKNVLSAWSLIIIFILFDILLESFSGQNILGYGELYGSRIVSLFKDEPIVGGYIYSFYLIILGFLFYEFNQRKNLVILFSMFFLICIILTGERSNTIKAFLGVSIFFLTIKEYDFKKKIIFFISSIIIFLILVFNSEFLKVRFIVQIKALDKVNNEYFMIYRSGYEVFKNNKLFGVGNKNYRIETCKADGLDLNHKRIYYCTTHPHQIYFEMLSEHGLVGTILMFFIFFQLIFSRIKEVLLESNYIQIGSLIYLVIVFIPLLPGGAFFNDYMLTLFMINLSIFYGSNKRFNIFNQDN